MILRPSSAIGYRTSVSTASREQVRGFLPSRIRSSLTSRHLCFGSAQSACLHGRTHYCTLCGQVMDKWGDHALVCGCGGDWASHHNLWFSLPPTTGLALVRSSRSLGSLSLMTLWTTTALLAQTRWIPPLVLAARPTSGSSSAPATAGSLDFSITIALRVGPVQSRGFCWGLHLGGGWVPQEPISETLPHCVLKPASLFAPWLSRRRSVGLVGCPSVGGILDRQRKHSFFTRRLFRRQLQDCAAHLVHPSQGKRARDLEAGLPSNLVRICPFSWSLFVD